jgi:hypothetical protein
MDFHFHLYIRFPRFISFHFSFQREQKLQREAGGAESSDEVESLAAVSRTQEEEMGNGLGGVAEDARWGFRRSEMEAERPRVLPYCANPALAIDWDPRTE